METLYGRGFTERAIAASLGISQPRVSKDLRIIRERNVRWYDQFSDPKRRRRALYKQVANQFRDVLQEQWVLFSQVPKDKLGLRNSVLGNITQTLSSYANRLGLVTPSMDVAWMQEELARLRTESVELRQKAKIIPLAQPIT